MARLNSIYGFFNCQIVGGFKSQNQKLATERRTTIDGNFLDYCIQIEEIRVSRRTSIPHKVNFHLDLNTLKQIEEIQANKRRLQISSAKITNLRYYVLLDALAEQQLVNNRKLSRLSIIERSPFTFSTNYSFSTNQQPTTVLRSAIDLKGKISQQVRQDLCQNPQLLARISRAHHWLILEILAQLPLKECDRYSWLVLGCSLIVTALFGLVCWYLFPFSKLVDSLLILGVLGILNTTLKKTIVKQLKRWIVYHLVAGLWANSVKRRQIGLKILRSIMG